MGIEWYADSAWQTQIAPVPVGSLGGTLQYDFLIQEGVNKNYVNNVFR